jgi:hypothetical protein
MEEGGQHAFVGTYGLAGGQLTVDHTRTDGAVETDEWVRPE